MPTGQQAYDDEHLYKKLTVKELNEYTGTERVSCDFYVCPCFMCVNISAAYISNAEQRKTHKSTSLETRGIVEIMFNAKDKKTRPVARTHLNLPCIRDNTNPGFILFRMRHFFHLVGNSLHIWPNVSCCFFLIVFAICNRAVFI